MPTVPNTTRWSMPKGTGWLAVMAVSLVCLTASAPATTVIAPEFSDLVNQSDFIVRAVVKSVNSEFAPPGSRKIITKVELEVKEVIAGTPPRVLD